MADEDVTKKQEPKEPKEQKEQKEPKEPEEQNEQKTDEKTSGGGALPWIITAVAVLVCAGAGLGLGRLFAGSPTPQTDEPPAQKVSAPIEDLKTDADSTTQTKRAWYYDLDPVVANLDVPGVTRYVRASLTLEINPEIDKEKGSIFLEEKNPLLTNWLTIYLASLTLEDIRGDKNLKRIQSQILDAFNERLFPDAKPQIKHILFKEFAIQ